MDILLVAINAKYIHSNLAVYSLKAAADNHLDRMGIRDVSISIAEFTINHYIDDILPEIYKRKPDVAAFSCYIWNIAMVEELTELVHKTLPDTQIWLGGPEVSYDAAWALENNPSVRLVMCGEGEDTFNELAAGTGDIFHRENRFLSDDELDQIAGLTYRNSVGKAVFTGARPEAAMDTIPFPYEDMELFKNKIIYYESSRGCPFSCSYCLSSIDKHVRYRSLDLVFKELDFFLKHKVPQVKFVDRTFNCSHERTQKIWRFLMEHDNGITNFHFEITASLLNDAEIALLNAMRPGLVQLEIGVQSTNAQTIKEIDRVTDFNKLSDIVRRIHEGKNVHQHLDLIAGLPYEDLESFIHSFNDVYALKPQQLQMGFLKVLKGSKMHRVRDEYGLVYRSKPVYEVISTRWIDYSEILLLKGVEEMVEVYYNSCQFRLSMEYLAHFFEHPFALYQALAHYYEEHSYAGQKYSRLDRYSMLKNFACGTLSENDGFLPQLFAEILIYDLYLRENAKSRPSWAADERTWKTQTAAFYSSKEMRDKYFPGCDEQSYRQIRNRTHIEYFHADIPESAALGKRVGDKCAVLFDYENRNPLTYEAVTKEIRVNEMDMFF